MPTVTSASKKQPNTAAFHDLDFDGIYAVAARQNDMAQRSAFLNDKTFTIKDGGGVSYRVINHWMSEGLIEDDREAPSKGWRKLSLKDIVWLHIIRDLRKFGLPIEKIRVVQQSLFNEPQNGARNFELAMLLCAAKPPLNFFIVVFEDGTARIATLQSLWYNEAVSGYAAPYIRISLNDLVCTALGSDRYAPERVHPVVLTAEEIDVVGSYREGNFDELRIHTKDGGLDRIDKTRSIREPQRLHALIDETRFGEIKIKVDNGKIIHTYHTKQEKR